MKLKIVDECGIWELDDLLSQEELSAVDRLISTEEALIEESSTLRPPVISHSVFNYMKVPIKLSQNSEVRTLLELKLKSAFSKIFQQIPSDCTLNRDSRLMVKTFKSDSHYHLHIELPHLFGSHAFVLFLTNESDGALEFPSESGWIEQSCHVETINFINMTKKLKPAEELVWSQGREIVPKRNKCVFFRVNTPHRVRHCTGKRTTITGWPFAQLQ